MSDPPSWPTFDPRLMLSLVVVGEERSVRRAAARLGVSESTLAGHLTRLERQLGADVIAGSEDPVQFTAAGARFLRECRAIVTRAGQLQSELAGHGEVLVVHIGDALNPIHQRIVSLFCAANPRVRVEVVEGTPSAAIEAAWTGKAHVGFGLSESAPSELTFEPIDRSELGLACAETHRLAAVAYGHWQDLTGEPLILPARGVADGYVVHLRQTLSEHDVDWMPAPAPSVAKATYLASFIARGQGSLICPRWVFEPCPRGVSWVPLRPTTTAISGLLWNPRTADDVLRRFVRHAMTVAATSTPEVAPRVPAGEPIA